MLTAKQQLNLAGAREYFREHLSTGDYNARGKKVSGEWFGQAAENLGLKGKASKPTSCRFARIEPCNR